MACWQDSAIIILRNLIWDNDDTVLYSDARLEEVLVVGASQVVAEVPFDVTYTVNVGVSSISPDPSDDEIFMYLMTLKAACIVDRGNARLAAMKSGLEAKCGPATMKTLKHMEGFATLLSMGYCAAYEQAKKEYQFGDATWFKAVLSPFVNSSFLPYTDSEAFGAGSDLVPRTHRPNQIY